MSIPELHQFSFSHFNEKARWAFDYKGVPHTRRSYLPGPHVAPIKRLSGRPQVPVAVIGGDVVAGSSAIIDRLEAEYPAPPLYPADPEERRRALELRDRFDEKVGPATRLAIFYGWFPDARYTSSVFATGTQGLKRTAYRAIFPALVPVLRRRMSINTENAARARETTREALDFVVRSAGPEGYLVGDRFSVADLTAASLLMLTTFPPELQFELPPGRVYDQWMALWADHPGTAWVSEIFRRHRGKSAEVKA
jgi:glutathione S-transferase